jgi:IS5 family transposase
MAQELATKKGRAARRERVAVEHTLARVSAIQGNRARFRGLAKNQFDLERTAVVNNCFVIAGQRAA